MKTLQDAIYGCIIGGAIGDSLGAATEGMYYQEIEKQYGQIETLEYNPVYYTNHLPGSVTDDTQMRQLICKAITDKKGRITPQDMANVLVKHLNPEKFWVSDVLAVERLKAGISPWQAGAGAISCGCACMGIAPVGIINMCDPEQAFQDGVCIAMVHNTGENVEFAGAFACAQAAAFMPGMTIDKMLSIMYEYSTEIVRRAFDMTWNLVEKSATLLEFRERYYEKMLDWTWPTPAGGWSTNHYFSGNAREFVPVIFAILHYTSDINQAMLDAANFGRDCDTIASMVGNIAGAIQGASCIRKDWIAQCESANKDMFDFVYPGTNYSFKQTAQDLLEAVRCEVDRKKKLAEFTAALL